MVVLLKILGWYVAIGLVYGAIVVFMNELDKWIFDNRNLTDVFIRAIDEKRRSMGMKTHTEIYTNYMKLDTFTQFKFILYDMVFWPMAIYKYWLKGLIRKPKN